MIYILASYATYRLARMIALEDGAFDVFATIRNRIDPEQNTWVGRGLNCPLCVGFWIALAATVVIQPQENFILAWFAIAGGQVFLQLQERS